MALSLARLLLVLGLGFSLSAEALPADVRLSLTPGSERFLKVDFKLEGAFVHPPTAAHVEPMRESDEVFLRVAPEARGPLLVFAYSAYRLHAWSVCVSDDETGCPPPSDPLLAAKACPGFGPGDEEGEKVWKGVIKDAACLESLLVNLKDSEVSARSLRLVMEEAATRAWIPGVFAAIPKEPAFAKLRAAFLGPTLVLRGEASRQTLEKLLFLVWERTAASVSFDADDLKIVSESK